jgi:hypothetical protein
MRHPIGTIARRAIYLTQRATYLTRRATYLTQRVGAAGAPAAPTQ